MIYAGFTPSNKAGFFIAANKGVSKQTIRNYLFMAVFGLSGYCGSCLKTERAYFDLKNNQRKLEFIFRNGMKYEYGELNCAYNNYSIDIDVIMKTWHNVIVAQFVAQ